MSPNKGVANTLHNSYLNFLKNMFTEMKRSAVTIITVGVLHWWDNCDVIQDTAVVYVQNRPAANLCYKEFQWVCFELISLKGTLLFAFLLWSWIQSSWAWMWCLPTYLYPNVSVFVFGHKTFVQETFRLSMWTAGDFVWLVWVIYLSEFSVGADVRFVVQKLPCSSKQEDNDPKHVKTGALEFEILECFPKAGSWS